MNDCQNAEIRDQLPDLLHDRLEAAARLAVAAHVETCVDCHEELELLRVVLGLARAQTPTVDVAAIVRALPAPPKPMSISATQSLANVPSTHAPLLVDSSATPIAPKLDVGTPNVIPIALRRRVWSDWRVAAAVTLLVAGGSSTVLLKRGANVPDSVSVAAATTESRAPGGANGSAGALSPVAQTPNSTSSTATSSAGESPTNATAVAEADDRANTDIGNGGRLGDLNDQQLQALLDKIDKLPAVPVAEPEPVTLQVSSQSSEGA